MKKGIIQNILFILLIIMLLAPALQYSIHIFKVDPLNGASAKTEYQPITTRSWFEATYQQNTDKWVNENFGFRPLFVRLNNQLEYSLLSKINARNVYEGSDNYLFRFYTPGMQYHTNYRGEKWLGEKIKQFKFVSQKLEEEGKKLVLVIAPGKYYYYSEFLPERNKSDIKKASNYNFISKQMKKNNLACIDLNAWFLQEKEHAPFPVYSRGGIHWTQLASFLAMDSLVHYMQAGSNEDFPEISWEEPKPRKTAWSPDVDIYKALNIIFPWNEKEILYAPLKTDSIFSKKPDVLMIADSYFHAPSWSGIPKKYFSDKYAFWYYNKQVFNANNQHIANVEDLNLGEEINKREYIFILSTVMNLENFGWKFIDKLYDYYTKLQREKHNLTVSEKEKKIKSIILRIKSNKKWLNSVKKKAKEKEISLDSMLRIDAIYMINRE